jgi:hypothetical protein
MSAEAGFYLIIFTAKPWQRELVRHSPVIT